MKQPEVLKSTEGRQRFFSLLHQVEKEGATFLFESKGHPIAILTAPSNFPASIAPSGEKKRLDLLKRIRAFRKSLEKPSLDSTALIRELREERTRALSGR